MSPRIIKMSWKNLHQILINILKFKNEFFTAAVQVNKHARLRQTKAKMKAFQLS